MQKIKLFVMDVDGTMTDGKIYIGRDGEIMKATNIKTGEDIALPKQWNNACNINCGKLKLSGKELGITEVHQGSKDKVKVLSYLCEKFNVTTNEIAYIGDDLGDLLAMKAVGLSFCPADSVNEILKCADIKLNHNGGEGAVREAVEYLLNITINNN